MGRAAFTDTVWEADSMEEGKEKSYGFRLLISKKTTDPKFKELKAAIDKAAVDRFGKDFRTKYKEFHYPIHDGDDKADVDGHAGHWYLNLKRKEKKKRPGVVDRNRNPITRDEDDGFYAGCWCHATVSVGAFETKNSKGVVASRGVTLTLFNILKVKDGPKFGGNRPPEEDFEGLEIEDDGSDDASNYNEPNDDDDAAGSDDDDMLG